MSKPLPYDVEEEMTYNLIPTIEKFHNCGAQKRCIVGPVGSGKTTAACWEVCYFLPKHMYEVHGVKKTIFVVVRNTSIELRDTTLRSLQEWFPFAEYKVQAMILTITWPDFEVELMLRACDNAKHVRQFKSLQVTGYWIDESIEVAEDTKRMLKTRIGRFPKRSPAKFGIETTNPPDVEHPTYSQFKWDTPPPGPKPSGKPLEKHVGFWQPPYENVANLPINYYEDLKADYAANLDWLEMYVEGKPGQLIRGKLVYDNFDRTLHMSEFPLKWGGQHLFRGWDNSGNTPACIVVCPVTPGRLHVFREFTTVRENAVDFANRVIEQCNMHFPGAKFTDYGDPAGEAQYSTRDGTFTSNKQLMADECGIDVISGEQNFKKRVNSVDQALLRRDGILIDPSCVRLYNGFMGGYHFPELTNLPGYYMKEPQKNKYAHIAEALQYVCTMLYVSAAPPIDQSELGPEEELEETY